MYEMGGWVYESNMKFRKTLDRGRFMLYICRLKRNSYGKEKRQEGTNSNRTGRKMRPSNARGGD
jgi:hypothetical protein